MKKKIKNKLKIKKKKKKMIQMKKRIKKNHILHYSYQQKPQIFILNQQKRKPKK